MSWWEWALAVKGKPSGTAGAAKSAIKKGCLGPVAWEARVTARPVSYGINPRTLLKGQGRVARLVLYQSIGRAEVPHKLAVYDHGWHFGRKRHLGLIQRVVAELERQGGL